MFIAQRQVNDMEPTNRLSWFLSHTYHCNDKAKLVLCHMTSLAWVLLQAYQTALDNEPCRHQSLYNLQEVVCYKGGLKQKPA